MGSRCSVHQLFERYGDVVYRRCLQMLRDEEAAFDALQDVFLRVVRDTRFRGDCSPMTWLYRIATTYCLQQLRNQRRREAVLRRLSEGAEGGAFAPDPDAALIAARILDEHDDVTRQIAYLRFADGLTLEETAEVLGISRKTVARRMQQMSEYAKQGCTTPKEGLHG